LYQDLVIIYIKNPIITERCDVYNSRSTSHNDGKLLIDNHVAKCRTRYYVMSYFKTEIINNYCTITLKTLVLPDYSLEKNIYATKLENKM